MLGATVKLPRELIKPLLVGEGRQIIRNLFYTCPEADIETLMRQDVRDHGFLSDRHIRRDGPGV